MRLLLVEDEQELARLVKANLGREGFAVDTVERLADARAALAAARYDAILLDLSLPDGDGLSLLAELRRAADVTPIIAVTARDAIDARVAGLNAGADDYLVKPFALSELLARLRAILRRPNGALGLRLKAGNVAFDASTGNVWIADAALILPRRELAALELLMRRAGQVVARTALEESVYGFDDDIESNAIEVTVSRLRKRLAAGGADAAIHTVRGVGYMLAAPSA